MIDIKAQVTRMRVQYITSLETNQILQFLKDMSSRIPGMKYPDHDEEKKRFKVTTNREDSWRNEIHALAAEKTVEIAWGPDIPSQKALQYVETFGTVVAERFDDFLIEAYDCYTLVEIRCPINPYSVFEKNFYNSGVLSKIKHDSKEALESDLRTYDNDIRLVYGIADSLVLAINISGNATHDEVNKGKFDEDTEIRVTAGLLESDPKSSDAALASRFVGHTEMAIKVFEKAVFPNTLELVKAGIDVTG